MKTKKQKQNDPNGVT